MSDIEVVFTPYPLDAAQRGAELLDEKMPGWRKQMDLRYPLGMARVLYAEAMRKAGRKPWTTGTPIYYGVDAVGAKGYGMLQQAWREILLDGRP